MTSCISGEEPNGDIMKSHAYVESIEDGVAKLELRLTPTTFVPPDGGHYRHPRKIVEVPAEELIRTLPEVKQMDVVVVEHTEGVIQSFCYIDYKETERRRERAKARQEALERKMQGN